jgi:hypothetical protein
MDFLHSPNLRWHAATFRFNKFFKHTRKKMKASSERWKNIFDSDSFPTLQGVKSLLLYSGKLSLPRHLVD